MLCLAPLFALGQPAIAADATWSANPGSGDFNTAANWSPATVPDGTATFGASTNTSLSFSANATMDGWTFNSGAYDFTVARAVSFDGAGITVNGGRYQFSGSCGHYQ